MKKVLLFIVAVFFLTGCSPEDEGAKIDEIAPILSVEVPDSLTQGEINLIKIIYKRPSSCHYFSGFDLYRNNNQFEVGIITSYRSNRTNCSTTGNLEATAELNFVAEREDFYIFKFWQGVNAEGENKFLRIEVPVTRPGN